MRNLFFATFAILSFGFTLPTKQGVVLDGTYENKKGSTHPAACHGTNVGIITLDTDERIAICFDELPGGKDIRVGCQNITVEGHYRQHKIDGGAGACKPGAMTILYVTKWRCQEQD